MRERKLFFIGLAMVAVAVVAVAGESAITTQDGTQLVSDKVAGDVFGGARCAKSTKLTEEHCKDPGCTPMVYWMLDANGNVDDVRGFYKLCLDEDGNSCGDACEVAVPCDHPL
jgi:hypothetical protein